MEQKHKIYILFIAGLGASLLYFENAGAAFLIQFFLRRKKIADVNSDILISCRQMSKSRRQIYFLLLAHYQPTTLLRQAGNLLLESFGTLIFIMIT